MVKLAVLDKPLLHYSPVQINQFIDFKTSVSRLHNLQYPLQVMRTLRNPLRPANLTNNRGRLGQLGWEILEIIDVHWTIEKEIIREKRVYEYRFIGFHMPQPVFIVSMSPKHALTSHKHPLYNSNVISLSVIKYSQVHLFNYYNGSSET